jgi:hypothetical protein
MKPSDSELDRLRSRRTRLIRIPSIQEWFSFRISYYYLIHLMLLMGFGWMAMGGVGLTIAFWVVLLWYSAWQRPFHPEFFVIAGLGLIAAAGMLPERVWDNLWWFVGFLVVAASPLVDFILPVFRSR